MPRTTLAHRRERAGAQRVRGYSDRYPSAPDRSLHLYSYLLPIARQYAGVAPGCHAEMAPRRDSKIVGSPHPVAFAAPPETVAILVALRSVRIAELLRYSHDVSYGSRSAYLQPACCEAGPSSNSLASLQLP